MTAMTDDIVNIEVDGKPVEARRGQMIIEVTDRVGAYVPRFCYHDKLSIAANCRMCLVEVEKAPKPLPACATPVNEGMKVFTKSPKAIAAQKATMEFLLINHPLDCPICDQGGECELQDLSMGFGRDVSRYNDGKRVVKDKDIGPLIATEMTRCIHCTRCVRFGEEIQGNPQLGTTERGERVKISTYVEQGIDHELSANVIDLCPVGALTNKPFRFGARAWEMVQHETIAPHDCVGSNLYAHVLRGTVRRIVPRNNEAINETWIPDRDRFSYEAIYSSERLLRPRVKESGEWRELDWEDALGVAADALRNAESGKSGFVVSPSVTVEEAHLLAKLAAHLGTANIDHRVMRRDLTDQDNDPVFPSLGCGIADIEDQGAILVVGSNLRAEAPIIAHRVRKAALGGGCVSFVNAARHEYLFDVHAYLEGGLVDQLAGVVVAAAGKDALPASVASLCKGVTASEAHKAVAASLKSAPDALVLLGNVAGRSAAYGAVRALVLALCDLTGATMGSLSEGANAAGVSLAGVLPHRTAGGAARKTPGLGVAAMLEADLDAIVLLNLEPDADIGVVDDAVKALARQKFVVALTPFMSDALAEVADLLLPIGSFAETSGTFVNVEGKWQSFGGVASPVGESRPAWKVLRVLGNLVEAPGFDFVTSEDVLEEARAAFGEVGPGKPRQGSATATKGLADDVGDIAIYAIDGLVRRARALQQTPAALRAKREGDQ